MSVFPNYGPGERGYLIEMMQIVPIVNPPKNCCCGRSASCTWGFVFFWDADPKILKSGEVFSMLKTLPLDVTWQTGMFLWTWENDVLFFFTKLLWANSHVDRNSGDYFAVTCSDLAAAFCLPTDWHSVYWRFLDIEPYFLVRKSDNLRRL